MTAPRPLVEINNLSKHYPLGTRLLHKPDVVRAVDGVSLQVFSGQSLGLVGESGCGKSTLGRAVLRLVEPTGHETILALDAGGLERFEALKAWRSEVAREHNLPAYVVFHDASLAEMAREQPESLEALAGVSGVGAKKLEAYGREILRVLALQP